jgi:hypothetical protein
MYTQLMLGFSIYKGLLLMNRDHLYWDGFTQSAHNDIANRLYKSLFDNAKSNNWDVVFTILSEGDARWIENRRAINVCEPHSEQNNSLLHYAAAIGAGVAIVERLIEFGALRNLRNNSDQKPIDIAKGQAHTHLFDILEPVNKFDISLEELKLIEQHFHDVIMRRENGHIGEDVKKQSLRLPQLEPLLELDKPDGWFPIPGYMGGFSYWLRVDDAPMRLISESGSRMDAPGQEQLHEITSTGSELLEPEDMDKRSTLSLKLHLR